MELLRLKTVPVGSIFYYFDRFWYTCQISITRFDKAAAREVEKGTVGGGGVLEVRKEKGKVGEAGIKHGGEGVVRVVSGDKVVSEGGKDATVGHVKGGVKGDCKGVCSDNADKVIEGAMVEATDKVDSVEGVRVGDVLVRVQKKNPNPKEFVSGKKGTSFEAGGYISNKRGQPSIQKLVCKYKSREGMMASVVNGESIPDVQNRIADAGFSDIVITSVGANIVLLRSSSNVLFHTRINDAKEFFDHFFTNLVRWEKEILSFQRGVWLRIYGVLIHAWNESFFKLCSLDCGRFLRTNAARWRKKDLITLEFW